MPRLDSNGERSLIAVAYAHPDPKQRRAAHRQLTEQLPDAALLEATLTKRFHRAYEHDACERLRRLRRTDRGAIAALMVAHGAYGYGVALEDPAFARELVPKLIKKRTLDLTEYRPSASTAITIDVSTIPDPVFDVLANLRGKLDGLIIWGSRGLTTLPPRFRELAFLKELTFGYLGLESLPDVVCTFEKLEMLNLRGEHLARLNKKMSKLTRLRELWLVDVKRMKAIPDEIWQLANLRSLNFPYTKFRELPAAIGRLENLEHLNLQGSKFTRLPDEIGQLRKLKMINIRYSKLRREHVKKLVKARIIG